MVDNVNGLNALPIGSTTNNVPAHIQLLKDDINGGSIIRRLTGAQIAALGATERVAGVIVYNTTTSKHQTYNGAAWIDTDATAVAAQATANAALPKAGGTMTGPIAMGSQKITGLAKGTATGDAMARQQVQSGTVPPFTSLYTTISFSPSFASAPVVVATPTNDTSASIPSFWVTNVSASSARIWNGTAGAEAMGFNWIAVGD